MGKSVTHHQQSTAYKNRTGETVEARTLPKNAHQLGVTPVIHAKSLIHPRLAKPTSSYSLMSITAIEEADAEADAEETEAEADAEVAEISQRVPNLLLH
jgi:hypothetical protein